MLLFAFLQERYTLRSRPRVVKLYIYIFLRVVLLHVNRIMNLTKKYYVTSITFTN